MPGASFCGACGKDVGADQPTPTPPQSAAVYPAKAQTRRRSPKIVLLAAVAIIVAVALGIGFLPDLLKGGDIRPVTVERDAEPLAAGTASEATALALRQYIYARLATELFAEAVAASAPREELAEMADELLLAWEEAALYSSVAAEISDQAVAVHETAVVKQTSAAEQMRLTTLAAVTEKGSVLPLAAGDAQKTDPRTWAANLTKQYDALKGAKRYQQLAAQLGTDAKTAYEQMVLAQAIIHDDATAEAEYNDTLLKTAQVIKTTSKVGVFITATIVTGGGTLTALPASGFTLAQTAGTIVGGVDCLVDVADTGSTIFLGENNQVALAAAEAKKYLGPVSSVFGVLNWQDAASGEKLAYIGDALSDWFFEGKFAGVQVFADRDGGMRLTAQVFEAGGKAGLKSALKAAGYIFPDNVDIKALSDVINGWKPDRELMIARLDALAAQMAEIRKNPELFEGAEDNGLEAIPEDELEEWESALEEREEESASPENPTPNSQQMVGGISGTYVCDINGTYVNGSYQITIQDNGDGTAVVSNFDFWDLGSESLDASFDVDTGHFSFEVFEAWFKHTSDGFTALGEFYVEGEKHNVSLRRVSG